MAGVWVRAVLLLPRFLRSSLQVGNIGQRLCDLQSASRERLRAFGIGGRVEGRRMSGACNYPQCYPSAFALIALLAKSLIFWQEWQS